MQKSPAQATCNTTCGSLGRCLRLGVVEAGSSSQSFPCPLGGGVGVSVSPVGCFDPHYTHWVCFPLVCGGGLVLFFGTFWLAYIYWGDIHV